MNTAVLFMSGTALTNVQETTEESSEPANQTFVDDTSDTESVNENIQVGECTGLTILCF